MSSIKALAIAKATGGSGGGGEITLETLNADANATYNAPSGKAYKKVNVNVPNSYAAGDEGKVVSGGALVAQTAHADVTPTTSDQTIDTTSNNSIKVKGDADLVAGNIKKDVEIFGVTGTYEGGGGGTTSIEEWDLTNSFTGEKRGVELTVSGVELSQSGAVYDSASDSMIAPAFSAVTVELDVAMMQLQSGTHRRFVMTGVGASAATGLIYRSTGVWALYSNGAWENSNITDGNYFDNSLVKIVITADGTWEIYKNDVLVWTPTTKLMLSPYLVIGSSSTSINNAVISGMRLY